MDENQPTRIYNDGPCFPRSSLAVEAEAAYRHWFARTAEGVPTWQWPNRSLFNQFMLARASVRNRAVIGEDNGVCLFRPRHEIEASKARGRAQAVWIAIEGWEHFTSAGFDVDAIRSIAMPGWNARVQRWSKALLRPDQIVVPPRPHENVDSETQDQLDGIRDSWNLAYDSLPRSAYIRPRSLRRLLSRFPLLQPPVIHGLLRMTWS